MIWYSESLEHVIQELKTDSNTGLDQEETQIRLQTYGENKLQDKPHRTFFQRFIGQLKDVMVIILMIAAAISFGISIYQSATGGEADWIEPIVIILILIINGLLGALQESKAESALEALKSMSAPSARVWRNGMLQTIKSTELVPGDIINLEAGDLIPADCRLVQAASFKSDESPLTGESFPVEKNAIAVSDNLAPLGDRLNMAYSGCAVTYGRAHAVVVDTGMNTEMGKIAAMLETGDSTTTPLQIKLAQLGKVLGFLALGICLIVFIFGLFCGINPLTIFMVAVSLAVAAIPEGLPAIATIVLAIGVQRLAAKNAIIRRLPAVETLGSASVICSDKTGTLTQNRMTLTKVYDGKALLSLNDGIPENVSALIRLATLCTDGKVQVVDGIEKHFGDPTETAIISAARKIDLYKENMDSEFPRLGEIPFDSDRKLMTTVNMIHDHTVVIVKGAPDVLFKRCIWNNPESRKAAENANGEMGRGALRVLAVGYKYIDKIPVEYRSEDLEDGLTFGGLLGMIDPPRPEAIAAIRECNTAGIRTVMITGDHVVTASAIAKELGILQSDEEAISGAALAGLSDNELYQNIRRYRVYARVTPSDKIRIVKAWKKAGEIVAMTGDGVNDAPALKAADIGCAMGITGTDVAKGASDMVLTDDNFATIVSAVKEGRGIYDNIRKAVHFLLSCNLGEIITVFFAMIIWRESPLMPIQLLWINLVTDSLPAIALGMEPVEFDVMERKPRPKKESIFANGLGLTLALQGLIIGVLSLAAYFIGSRVFLLPGGKINYPLGESMSFATLAISQLVHAFNARSSHSLFHVGFHTNRTMLGAFGISLLLMLAVLIIPPLSGVFEVTALTANEWGIVAGLSLAPLIIVEAAKAITALFHKKNQDE